MNIPSKPPMPETTSPEAMIEYQRQMADYNLAIQTIQQTQNEEQTTRSNMSKSRHDAMMAIANNMKA